MLKKIFLTRITTKIKVTKLVLKWLIILKGKKYIATDCDQHGKMNEAKLHYEYFKYYICVVFDTDDAKSRDIFKRDKKRKSYI